MAVIVCWLSALLFVWRVIRLHHGVGLQSQRESPQLPRDTDARAGAAVEDLLRQRFVEGEISTEEYERLLEVLMRNRPLPDMGAMTTPLAHTGPSGVKSAREPEALVILRACTFLLRLAGVASALLLWWIEAALSSNPDGWGELRNSLPILLPTLVLLVFASLASLRRSIGSGERAR
jgi:hypothetical protein